MNAWLFSNEPLQCQAIFLDNDYVTLYELKFNGKRPVECELLQQENRSNELYIGSLFYFILIQRSHDLPTENQRKIAFYVNINT